MVFVLILLTSISIYAEKETTTPVESGAEQVSDGGAITIVIPIVLCDQLWSKDGYSCIPGNLNELQSQNYICKTTKKDCNNNWCCGNNPKLYCCILRSDPITITRNIGDNFLSITNGESISSLVEKYKRLSIPPEITYQALYKRSVDIKLGVTALYEEATGYKQIAALKREFLGVPTGSLKKGNVDSPVPVTKVTPPKTTGSVSAKDVEIGKPNCDDIKLDENHNIISINECETKKLDFKDEKIDASDPNYLYKLNFDKFKDGYYLLYIPPKFGSERYVSLLKIRIYQKRIQEGTLTAIKLTNDEPSYIEKGVLGKDLQIYLNGEKVTPHPSISISYFDSDNVATSSTEELHKEIILTNTIIIKRGLTNRDIYLKYENDSWGTCTSYFSCSDFSNIKDNIPSGFSGLINLKDSNGLEGLKIIFNRFAYLDIPNSDVDNSIKLHIKAKTPQGDLNFIKFSADDNNNKLILVEETIPPIVHPPYSKETALNAFITRATSYAQEYPMVKLKKTLVENR